MQLNSPFLSNSTDLKEDENMDLISILILISIPVLGTIKVLIQGVANKKGVKNSKDSLIFIGILFLSLATFVAIFFFREIPDIITIVLGILNGVLNVIFQVCYMQSFNVGPVSISGTIANFSMLIPLIFGFTYLNEEITPLKIIGILLTLVAFILLTKKEKNKRFSVKWFVLIMCAFLAAGIGTAIQSLFKTLPCASQRNEYLVVNYLFAAMLSFGLSLLFRVKENSKMTFHRYTVLGPIIIGIVLGIYQVLTMYGLSIIDVSIYYPVTSALAVIFLLVTGIFVFKERPTIIQYIGIAIGIIAVILVNL